MKNWIKKINENKFQFFFFIGILAFLFVSLIIIGATNNDPVDEPPVNEEPNTPVIPDKEEPTTTDTVELVMAFEEEFGCEIPDDAAEKILTVKDAIDYLSKNA